MDHPWRFAAADLCPVCSARHFPFCPPPLPPPHPYPYDLRPPPPPPPPFHAPFRPPPPPPPEMWGPGGFPQPPPPHGYEFPDREGPHKRMRVGEAVPLDLYDSPAPPPSRIASEGERLLGLIREHGRPPPPAPQWHGEPHQADGFGYGGRSNFSQNYHNHYVQGGSYNNYDDAGRLPPQERRDFERDGGNFGGLPHERYTNAAPAFEHGYNCVPRGPHHQFNALENSLGAPPQPPPRYAEAGNHFDPQGWYSELRPPPPPPQPPMPTGNANASPSDYHTVLPVPTAKSSLFPVLSSASASASLPPSAHILHQAQPVSQANGYNAPVPNEGSGLIYRPSSEQRMRDGRQTYAVEHSLNDAKATIINACHLFKQPLRASRPDHIVIILRGLPGSGKSYLAKALRDLEVENGGNAPRIHSMDDYFMIEVEKKIEDNEGSKSSSASKGRKQLTKKVIEYCYEPEMEETYRSSMLKAFKKTLDEGNFNFVIVDDRNLRVADFAQFWATAKRSGYEVYLLEAPYKDPTGCAARNVHGFTLDHIQKMAENWEEAPLLYLRLDIHSLFHGDDLQEHSIQEVDMDTEDVDDVSDTKVSTDKENLQKAMTESSYSKPDQGLSKPGEKWDSEEDDDLDGFKELRKSKWSKDFDEDTEKSEHAEGSTNALSGLVQAYGMRQKSVSWGDRLEKGGFSISAAKKRLASSLIIGPGSGYNLVSNPLIEDNSKGANGKTNTETKRRFSEQLRAESESFKAVFDRRRHRIGGLNNVDDE